MERPIFNNRQNAKSVGLMKMEEIITLKLFSILTERTSGDKEL